MQDEYDNSVQPKSDDERRLLELLREYPAPAADEDLFDAAVAEAVRRNDNRQRNRWIMTGFGGAIAAGLMVMLVSSVFFSAPNPQSTNGEIPGVVIALEQPRTINLVFAANEPLDGAMLTVDLPEGIEIAGFPGQRQVSWETSLVAGRNLLPLKLIATSPYGGELLAQLQHDDRSRAFRLQVNVS